MLGLYVQSARLALVFMSKQPPPIDGVESDCAWNDTISNCLLPMCTDLLSFALQAPNIEVYIYSSDSPWPVTSQQRSAIAPYTRSNST
eukprot:5175325-Amphidinium_carterae.1